MSMSPRKTAVHELGHAIVCLALGGGVEELSIVPRDRCGYRNVPRNVAGYAELDTAAMDDDDRAAVYAAGHAAELLANLFDDDDTVGGDIQDTHDLVERRLPLANESDLLSRTTRLYSRGLHRAMGILRSYWPALETLEGVAMSREHLAGGDVLRAMKKLAPRAGAQAEPPPKPELFIIRRTVSPLPADPPIDGSRKRVIHLVIGGPSC